MIDLNEEVFNISEALSAAFQSSNLNSEENLQRALEYEQKQKMLCQKVKQSIESHPSVQLIKGATIQHSPPQREREVAHQVVSQSAPMNSLGKKQSIETFGESMSPVQQSLQQFTQLTKIKDLQKSESRNRSRKSKSPSLPLRNRQGAPSAMNVSTRSEKLLPKSRSRSKQSRRALVPSASKQSLRDKRTSTKLVSKQSNATKKALHKIYSMDRDKPRKRSTGRVTPVLIPKYAGCQAGGVNASLMVKSGGGSMQSLERPSASMMSKRKSQ